MVRLGLLRDKTDALAGAFFITLGGVALILVWQQPVGDLMQMGPGYTPRLLGFLLIGLGALVLASSVRGQIRCLTLPQRRPLLLNLAAILVFAFCIDRFGLLPAVAAGVALSAAAGSESRVLGTIGLMIVLAAGSALLFVEALGLPMKLIH